MEGSTAKGMNCSRRLVFGNVEFQIYGAAVAGNYLCRSYWSQKLGARLEYALSMVCVDIVAFVFMCLWIKSIMKSWSPAICWNIDCAGILGGSLVKPIEVVNACSL